MHKLLELGLGNYLMVLCCVVGIVGTFIAAHQYKKLLAQSENMMGTTQPFLLQIKNKFKNAYYVNQGINDIELFVQKNLRGLNLFGFRTENVAKMANRCAGLCLLFGIVFASLGYIENLSFKSYITYLVTGIVTSSIAGVLVYLLDIPQLEEDLNIQLKEYLENTFTVKLEKSKADGEQLIAMDKEDESDELKPKKPKRQFTEKEEKLLEEILKEYFA
ncbi:hypothetical protein P261_01410 [Lachnospiraceae bacterium TWA4]|nr:hypothetical protein P261_01410 [Lachnospiraceae bacterium TWA4]